MTVHGTRSAYTNNGCRCVDCRRTQRQYARERNGSTIDAEVADRAIDRPWVLVNFPVAIVQRDRYDDATAIDLCFGAPPFSQARIDLEAKAVPCSSFAGPDDSSTSVDREHSGGPPATGVVLPDPTPILEAAQILAELVAIRDRAR